jgi:hypothetical protein
MRFKNNAPPKGVNIHASLVSTMFNNFDAGAALVT